MCHRHSDANCYSHTNPDRHIDAYSDGYANSDTYRDAVTDADSHGYPDGYANSDTYAYRDVVTDSYHHPDSNFQAKCGFERSYATCAIRAIYSYGDAHCATHRSIRAKRHAFSSVGAFGLRVHVPRNHLLEPGRQ